MEKTQLQKNPLTQDEWGLMGQILGCGIAGEPMNSVFIGIHQPKK